MHSNPNQVNESPRSQTSQNPLKNLRDQVQKTVWEILERGGDLDVTRQIYDNSAKDYDDDPETQAYFTLEYQKVMELLDIQDGEIVLDLGCGTGKYIHKFPTQTQIFGIDLSPEMIAVSQRKNSERKIEYHVGDLKAGLPFPDESFDKINSAHVLKFLTSQNDLEFAFKEIARVLKKGGTFVFTNNHPERKEDFEWADYNLNLPTPTQNTSPDEITIPMHLHTLHNYEEAYKASGLHFVEKSDIRIDETLQSILTKESFAKVQGKRIILAMKFTK